MSRPFTATTAELVVDAVEAASVLSTEATPAYVATFADQPEAQAEDALKMAADLSMLKVGPGGGYVTDNPLCRYTISPKVEQKAAVIRIILDSYQPFLIFKERLVATGNPALAAEQTKAILDLDAHKAEIKDTLISLGSYAQLLAAEGGGSYKLNEKEAINPLVAIVQACDDTDSAERTVRRHLGDDAVENTNQTEVLEPLADALWRAKGSDASGAIQQAGNAVESFLSEVGARVNANMNGAHGLNAKADRLVQHWTLPPKLLNVSRYLGHVRNAADHGIDADIGNSWSISVQTGIEYVFVSCSFISSVVQWELGNGGRL